MSQDLRDAVRALCQAVEELTQGDENPDHLAARQAVGDAREAVKRDERKYEIAVHEAAQAASEARL